MNIDPLLLKSNSPASPKSSSAFSYDSSEEEGHFSYSDLSPEYDTCDYDLASGFKKLRIKDDKDDLPIEYHKSGPMKPTFSFDAVSNFRKINPDYFWNIRLTPTNKTIILDFHSQLKEVLRYLYSKVAVHQTKYVHRLSVNFINFYHYPDKEFHHIIKFFTNSFPSTRYLYLTFAEIATRYRTNEDLIWLGLQISKSMPNLKHFVLQFHENDLISSEGFRLFCKQIARRCKKLEFLSLDFGKCEGVEGLCIKSLTKEMTIYLPLLKNLRLNLHITAEIDSEQISFNKTKCLKPLQSFDLFINPPPKSPSLAPNFQKDLRQLSLYLRLGSYVLTGLDKLASSCLQPLENLRFLNLHLSDLRFSEERARKFVETLNSKIKTLDGLKINFFSCTHIIQAFLRFLNSPEQNQLKNLKVGIDSPSEGSSLKGMPVKLFDTFTSSFLQPLKNLTSLDLQLQTVPIKDLQVKNLISCIAKDLQQLEFLNVFFFLCPKMTDESVKAFQEDFCAEHTLLNLKTLILSFSNCRQITKKPIKSLRSALKKRIPAIESGTINFIDYLEDPNFCSADDEDHAIAKQMEASKGPECKAVKIDRKADPESQDNWRFIRREEFEADSSYDESDGADEDASTGYRERGWWRRIKEDSENDEDSESDLYNEDNEEDIEDIEEKEEDDQGNEDDEEANENNEEHNEE